MKKIASLLSIVSIAAWSLSGDQSASACANTNSITASLASGSVVCKGNHTFEYSILVEWNTTSKPQVGQAWVVGSSNVKNLQITPDYWFPNACSGSVLLTVRGAPIVQGLPGSVQLEVEVGPPFAYKILPSQAIPGC